VIDGVPECLKMYTKRKPQLLRDFTEVVELIISSQYEIPLIIFTFSDSSERCNSFLNKIFGARIMDQKGQKV
jgi:hypothetical protein